MKDMESFCDTFVSLYLKFEAGFYSVPLYG